MCKQTRELDNLIIRKIMRMKLLKNFKFDCVKFNLNFGSVPDCVLPN